MSTIVSRVQSSRPEEGGFQQQPDQRLPKAFDRDASDQGEGKDDSRERSQKETPADCARVTMEPFECR